MRRPASMSPSRPGPVVAVSSGSSMSSAVGPKQDVAVDGRCHQHALGPLRRHRQHDRRHERPGQLVEDDELAPPGCDGELVVAEPAVDLIGEESGHVDDPVGPDRPLGRLHQPAARASSSRVTPVTVGAESQLDAGADRLGGERDARAPRADDRLVRDGNGAGGPVAEVRFAPAELVEWEPARRARTRWPAPWTARRPAVPLARRPRPPGRRPSPRARCPRRRA